MRFTNTLKYTIASILIVLMSFSLFSSCLDKNNDFSFADDNPTALENQDIKIAKFLVESTRINIQIVDLTKEVKDKSNNDEVKKIFKNQEASIFRIQNDISKLAEKKLVTIPNFISVVNSTNKKKEIIKETQFVDELMNLLVTEVILFEKIKIEVKDKSIIAFQEQYKPILDEHLEEISSLKVQNYINN